MSLCFWTENVSAGCIATLLHAHLKPTSIQQQPTPLAAPRLFYNYDDLSASQSNLAPIDLCTFIFHSLVRDFPCRLCLTLVELTQVI